MSIESYINGKICEFFLKACKLFSVAICPDKRLPNRKQENVRSKEKPPIILTFWAICENMKVMFGGFEFQTPEILTLGERECIYVGK